ncbi:glycoside hydrolase family 3 protein [Aureibacter tunicatorum]|uniref:beta-N-acetylhexosaminidase n=1 Tax=Aureibacter tunicatorum TaxID=866807 RepID=A0AAE4BVB0_9BACT|nr:glycoside hydrolase family 3 N-terminal domain-containing protein [Aureibacter tunicatorum]MDR6241707.1 beta-glucosidase-like glycosyl hydrolase [Aureibacter tunicatorum]BDD07308.1 hypothetical protein AUTU_47910 [Aureibacter tunicatorum]
MHLKDHEWVESMMSRMTLEQKVAQSIFVAGFAHSNKCNEEELAEYVDDLSIGGITFFQGEVRKQAQLINYLQEKSRFPLMMTIDAEWGLGMRLSDADDYPYQIALGAIEDNANVYWFGDRIAKQCKALGFHSALGPVIDINNNPDNPVISFRSFGEDKNDVLEKANKIVTAYKLNRLLDCIKHFPGHGDTHIDSHLELPVLEFDNERLEAVELFPFKKLIDEGASSVMVAHLKVKAWDDLPVSISKKIIKEKLREELGFEGLVISDALDMGALTSLYSRDEIGYMAYNAGNDILLNCPEPRSTIGKVFSAVEKGDISLEEVESKCRRILAAKLWLGLSEDQHLDIDQVENFLKNDQEALILNKKLAEYSLTLLKNDDNRLPFRKPEVKDLAILYINNQQRTRTVREEVAHHLIALENDEKDELALLEQYYLGADIHMLSGGESYEDIHSLIGSKSPVLIFRNGNMKPFNNFDISDELIGLVDDVLEKTNGVFMFLGNPLALQCFKKLLSASVILMGYQSSAFTLEAIVRASCGWGKVNGKLPVNIGNIFRAGERIGLY